MNNTLLYPYWTTMEQNVRAKRRLTADDARKALHKEGIDISEKEAEEILEFLYILAKLSVSQYVSNNDDQVI
ncbi:hypothetical protein [Mucilaginibacter sp.]